MSARVMILTIGHSTRTAEEFMALLDAHGATAVADVRRMPRSKRHPHFCADALSLLLSARGVAYRHLPGLGGLRRPRPESSNAGWRHEAFRGYADYMQTGQFTEALAELIAFATERRTAIMCAEAKWWQCHRQLVADALTARGMEVRHIMSASAPTVHQVTPFARVSGTTVDYPALVALEPQITATGVK